MINFRIISPCLLITICCVAVAQPQYRITKIVGRTSISDSDANRIKNYAIGWAQALQTTDTAELFNAHRHLIEPLELDVKISRYGRSLYGKALKDGFQSILSPDNDNEMAAVNALQVLSLLGTDEACGILLHHADKEWEERASLRLWSSIGLGKSFRLGILHSNRITLNADMLADFASRETKWYIVARQFDSIAAMQHVPDLNSREQTDLETQSLRLQARALIEFINDLVVTSGADERVRALPFVLPSLRIQLVEPALDADARSEAEEEILPALIQFAEYSTTRAAGARSDAALFAAYGEALQTAGLILDRILNTVSSDDVSLSDHWIAGNHQVINERIEHWKSLINK